MSRFGAVDLRAQLVKVALDWQAACGNAPSITSALSEYDAARLVGCSDYEAQMKLRSVVSKGHDFVHEGLRYQVKANRPSGRDGSVVTWVKKPTQYAWDRLVWLHYDTGYVLQEAWLWTVDDFKAKLGLLNRLSPEHLRQGHRLK